jgi:hypothetical protein
VRLRGVCAGKFAAAELDPAATGAGPSTSASASAPGAFFAAAAYDPDRLLSERFSAMREDLRGVAGALAPAAPEEEDFLEAAV